MPRAAFKGTGLPCRKSFQTRLLALHPACPPPSSSAPPLPARPRTALSALARCRPLPAQPGRALRAPSGPRSPEPGAAGPGGRGGAPAPRSPAGCSREG